MAADRHDRDVIDTGSSSVRDERVPQVMKPDVVACLLEGIDLWDDVIYGV